MNNKTTSIVFIDSAVDNYDFLLQGVLSGIEAVVLEADKDGVEQITEVLSQRQGLEVHIVSHGSPGSLCLGNTQLSLSTLLRYQSQLPTWFCSTLFLYACNVAAGDAGEELIEKLHYLTGANIAASTTKIGNTVLGGDWKLEYRLGDITVSSPFSSEIMGTYTGVLETAIRVTKFDPFGMLNSGSNPANIINADGIIYFTATDLRG